MKQIEVNNKPYLFIEVPDDATDFYYDYHSVILYNSKSIFDEKCCKGGIYDLPKNKIISTTKDISEEQCKKIIEGCFPFDHDMTMYYKDYIGYKFLKTAKKSLQSLIEANGLDINKNYLILLKTEK